LLELHEVGILYLSSINPLNTTTFVITCIKCFS